MDRYGVETGAFHFLASIHGTGVAAILLSLPHSSFCHTTSYYTAEVGKERCLVLGLILLCQGGAAEECLQVNKQGEPVASIAQEWEFGPSPLLIVDRFSHVLG